MNAHWTQRSRTPVAGNLAAWRSGDGPLVVLIHGVGLRAEAWGAVAAKLGTDFGMVAIDMPGHGQSPQDGARSLADYVTRVTDCVAALEAPVCIAGHSMGAMIALEVAAALPDQVRGVAALNAIFRRTEDASAAVQSRAAALKRAEMPSATPTLQRWFGPDPQSAEAIACRDWLQSVSPEAYAAAYHVFAHQDGPGDALLANLRQPALFLTGARDPNSTPAMSRAMAARVADGRAGIIEDAAHMLPMTHADETAAALLTTFGETR